MATILIVEDEYAVARGIEFALQQEGYEVAVARSGEEGLAYATTQAPDLIVLDVKLPAMDGFEVLRRLRAAGSKAPVLFLTARGDEFDKVVGLELGADDYVTKPFGLLELLARVEALLRRARAGLSRAAGLAEVERFGEVEVHLASRVVRRAGAVVELAPKEFELLVALLRARGAVVSRLELMERVWGYSAAVVTRTVDTHIAELRRKLERDPAAPRHILTARKAGYRLKAE